ncbi:MAG: hypothetical protein IT521_16385 [Burkholderiales bacterium]|nr:hypothetical protein [Burkholderiales bacterium]
MAGKSRRKPGTGNAVTAWARFAAVSRAMQPTGKARAKSSPGRGGASVAAPKGTQSLAQATAQAQRLGRAQAQWVVEQRRQARARRARAVAAAAASPRSGTPKSASTKATASTGLAVAGSGSRGVLVAEGDSWFDYPFCDVLQILDDDRGWDIEQVAHRGDSVESMAYDGGQLDDFVRAIERIVRRGEAPHAILISGGGNDVAGDAFAMLLNHRSSPVYGLNPAVVEGVLETRVRVAYTTVISAVTAACEALLGARVPILLHGYDYPVPDGRGVLGGWGPLPGPWLEPGFRDKGYDDLAERVAVARDLIDRFYAMLGAVVATPAFAHVALVDLRNTLSTDLARGRYRTWWGNELHPTRRGFAKVAELFDARL